MKALKAIIKTILATSAISIMFCISDSQSQTRLLDQKVKQYKESCDAVVNRVTERIKGNSFMSLRVEGKQIPDEWRQGARGRSIRLMVILGKPREGSEQRVNNVLSSPRMLTAMSKQLIESCNNIAVVSYGQSNTGMIRTFGAIGGVIREFEYVRGFETLRWGLAY